MKLYKAFSMLIAGLAITACSNDDAVSNEDPIVDPSAVGYLNLKISNASLPGTRTSVDDKNGDASEQVVKTVFLACFDASGDLVQKGIISNYKIVGKVGSGTDTSIGNGKSEKVPGNTQSIFLMINGTADMQNFFVLGRNWSQIKLNTFTGASSVVTGDLSGDGMNSSFVMVNAGNNDDGKALVDVTGHIFKVVANADNLASATAKAQEDAEASPVAFNVDRLASKVEVAFASPIGTTGTAGVSMSTWTLNVVNKVMYLYSDMLLPVVDGKDYRIDPNFYAAQFNANQFAYLPETAESDPAEFTATAATPMYAFENTMDGDQQRMNQSTSAVFKAVYTPDKTPTTGIASGTSWWLTEPDAQGVLKYMTTEQIHDEYVRVAALASNVITPTEAAFLADCDMFYARLAAGLTLAANETDFASLTASTGTTLETAKNIGQYSKPAATNPLPGDDHVGVQFFQKGVCFYMTYIHHDESVGDNNVKFLGLVRNNWYKLTVNSVSKPGTPWIPETPDKPVKEYDAYISVKVTINPWTAWEQGVDF